MQTFSRKLFRALVPGTLFCLLSGGVLLDIAISEHLEEAFDGVLRTRSGALIALTEDGDEGFELEGGVEALPGLSAESGSDYVAIHDAMGKLLVSSSTDGNRGTLPDPEVEPVRRYLDVTLPDGSPGRLLRTRFLPRWEWEVENSEDAARERLARAARQPLLLEVAVSRVPLDSITNKLHFVLACTGLALMTAILWVANRAIRAAVAPLEVLGAQIAALDETRLGQRLVLDTSIDEFDTLQRHVNHLLDRLDTAFQRERRFSSDVAHELRTPLTEMRTLAEVGRRFPDDPALREGFLKDLERSVTRMQHVVETLLALSRSESGGDRLVHCPDLGALLAAEVECRRALALERGLELHVRLPAEPVSVDGVDHWRLLIGNLLDNAIDYARAPGQIDVVLEKRDDRPHLAITNEVHDLLPDDVGQLFERFWRKDPARQATMHSGLGLSLVRACASRLGLDAYGALTDDRLTIGVGDPPTPQAST